MTGVRDIPAASAQRGMWAIEREMPGSTQYTLALERVLDKALDPESVRAALGDVLARREALRSSFRFAGGVLYQSVSSSVPIVPHEYVDLTEHDQETAQARFRLLRQEYQNTPLDLTTAPLLRLRQVRREEAGGAGYDTLLLVVHHLVADGISAQVIFADIAAACAARSAGKQPEAREVFENQTIHGLAGRLDEASREEPLPVRAARAGLTGATAPTVRARATCAAWTADAIDGRAPGPDLVLRLLPLPGGAQLIDPGVGDPAGQRP
jgi:NRPS condensation-like uncharacterized protein